MARNQVTKDVERVELGEGDWIDVRRGVDWGDLTDLVDDVLEAIPGKVVRIKTGALMRYQILAGLVAWGGPGWTEADGSVVALTLDTIRKLPPELASRIHTEVSQRNPGLLQAITGASTAGKGPASGGPSTSRPEAGA